MIAELEARSGTTPLRSRRAPSTPSSTHWEKDGAVKSYEKEAPTGRMRKYYRITRKGPAPAGRKEGGSGWNFYPYRQRHSGRNQSGPGMSAPVAAAPHRTISQFCDHVMHVRPFPAGPRGPSRRSSPLTLEDHKDAILEIQPGHDAVGGGAPGGGGHGESGRAGAAGWTPSTIPSLAGSRNLVRAGRCVFWRPRCWCWLCSPGGARTQSGRLTSSGSAVGARRTGSM